MVEEEQMRRRWGVEVGWPVHGERRKVVRREEEDSFIREREREGGGKRR